MNTIETNVCIVGGGSAGLLTAKTIAELGINVVLFEAGSTFAAGPSTKNEGWLHNGGYHASITADPKKAREIVQQIKYGHQWITGYAPEAQENPGSPTLALVRDNQLKATAMERWEMCGVSAQEIPPDTLRSIAPELNIELISGAYSVTDKSYNFSLLYRKYLADAEKAGAKTFLEATVRPEDNRTAHVTFQNGTTTKAHADLFIYTTGLGTEKTFGSAPNLRVGYWKSHSLIVPRLGGLSAYFIDPGEASVMHHGRFSIGCQSEDDFVVPYPNMEVVESSKAGLLESVARMIPGVLEHADRVKYVGCVKPNVLHNNGERSVEQDIFEPMENHLIAFPGKVTTTPSLAHRLAAIAHSRVSEQRIARRPGDSLVFDS